METNRATTSAGVAILVGLVAGVLSIVPVIERPDYLSLIPTHVPEIMLGAAFQLLMIPAYVGFALYLHPTLNVVHPTLSLAFVGFRLLAGMCHLLGVILLPLFLVLGHAYVGSEAGTDHIALLGDLLRSGRELINHVALILSLTISDLILFRLLHRSRLVPRWLSAWGFVGAGLAMLASLLLLAGSLQVVTPTYLAMNASLALQSIVLAAWLIARGFDTTALPCSPNPDEHQDGRSRMPPAAKA